MQRIKRELKYAGAVVDVADGHTAELLEGRELAVLPGDAGYRELLLLDGAGAVAGEAVAAVAAAVEHAGERVDVRLAVVHVGVVVDLVPVIVDDGVGVGVMVEAPAVGDERVVAGDVEGGARNLHVDAVAYAVVVVAVGRHDVE